MKISNEQVRQSMALPPAQRGEPATIKDLEEFAAVLKKTQEVLDAMPEIRAEHLREAQAHVEADGSTVASADIAEKLLGRVITDRIV